MLKDFELEICVEPLLTWFLGHARVLPWREEPTPYRVWVSEIMLQQTRVEAVKPYFERFMRELPTVETLAQCPEDKLLKLWEGLGYYNRVRNLKAAAVQIMEDCGGVIPSDYSELLKLTGIGHYTAGAVASIAYGRPVPAVDGNVLRVITRLTADDTDIMKQSFRNEMEQVLLELLEKTSAEIFSFEALPRGNFPGAFNQALMELGATVCLPNGEPHCAECPWQDMCRARQQGRIGELPVKTRAKARKIEERTVLIIRDGDKVAIRKRPKKGLLAGLYELPNLEGRLSAQEALETVKRMHFSPIRIERLADAKHIFSHVEWHMTGYAIRVEEAAFAETENPESTLLFVDAEGARERYAIPSAFAAYAQYLNIRLGTDGFEEQD
ncbi:MAG: A/G-specific adenine glycosylase [Roseburia sp.]